MRGTPLRVPSSPASSGPEDGKGLEFARAKPRSIAGAILYRTLRHAGPVVGRSRLLRSLLEVTRVLDRIAYEIAGERLGERFHCEALALTDEVLSTTIPSGGSVIDIGCSRGRWCRVAAHHARYVLGIDVDEKALAAARKCTVEKNVEYQLLNAEDVARLDRSFDVALLIHVLEHIDEADALLRSVSRIARTLIIEVPDVESDPLNWVRRRVDVPFYSDADHVREYSQDALLEQLTRTGWKVERIQKRGRAIVAVAHHATASLDPHSTDYGTTS